MRPLHHSIRVDIVSLHYSDLDGNGNTTETWMEREILTVCVLIRVPNGILKTPLLFATMDLVSTSHLSLVFTYVSVDEKFSSWRVFVSSRRVIFGKLPERSMAGILGIGPTVGRGPIGPTVQYDPPARG